MSCEVKVESQYQGINYPYLVSFSVRKNKEERSGWPSTNLIRKSLSKVRTLHLPSSSRLQRVRAPRRADLSSRALLAVDEVLRLGGGEVALLLSLGDGAGGEIELGGGEGCQGG